jgi:hypothetical protein
MSTIWMAIAPGNQTTRVIAARDRKTLFKAKLASRPSSPHALQIFLEAIAMWEGQHVCAALVVDGRSTKIDAEQFHGGFPPRDRTPLYSLQFISGAPHRGRDELHGMGRFDDLTALLASEAAR